MRLMPVEPPRIEEIEAIFFGAKLAINISFKLYHYLKSKSNLHRQPIEHMAHHERGSAHQERGSFCTASSWPSSWPDKEDI